MHKTDVVRRVARETRLSQRDVLDVINATHRLIEETLRDGRSVTFPGFGSFRISERQGGKVKHVKTGEVIDYPARRIATFHVGDILKRAVRGEHRRRGAGIAGRLSAMLKPKRKKKDE